MGKGYKEFSVLFGNLKCEIISKWKVKIFFFKSDEKLKKCKVLQHATEQF